VTTATITVETVETTVPLNVPAQTLLAVYQGRIIGVISTRPAHPSAPAVPPWAQPASTVPNLPPVNVVERAQNQPISMKEKILAVLQHAGPCDSFMIGQKLGLDIGSPERTEQKIALATLLSQRKIVIQPSERKRKHFYKLPEIRK